jgi:hypothetical protein
MPRVFSVFLLVVLSVAVLAPVPAAAVPVENTQFRRNWERTDLPVASLVVSRTWMWGPEATTNVFYEPYAEAPGGRRIVQYFDKARMEITDPNAPNADSIWFVSNGLLARELITGERQFGHTTFQHYPASQVNVAGDPADAAAPAYASFAALLNSTVGFQETQIRRGIHRDGSVYVDDRFLGYGVGAAIFVTETQHWVAQPFWDFMNSTGVVYQDGAYTTDRLFLNPFYATGFPITESCWATVLVGGVSRDVLIQCFERRCLTYTPGNPDGFETEAGNVGQHYYTWRYVEAPTIGAENNPIPLGATAALGDGWDLRVDGANRDATAEILAADPGNVPPQPGHRFVLAHVTATYHGEGQSYFSGGSRLLTVGQSGRSYNVGLNDCGTIPDPLPDPETATGGSVSGNLCWQVEEGDAGSLLMYDDPIQRPLPWRFYFALS